MLLCRPGLIPVDCVSVSAGLHSAADYRVFHEPVASIGGGWLFRFWGGVFFFLNHPPKADLPRIFRDVERREDSDGCWHVQRVAIDFPPVHATCGSV